MDNVAVSALVVSSCALAVSCYAIHRANKTASAATLISLHEGFRQGWSRYLDAESSDQEYELAELLNLLEIGCAIYLETVVTSNSRVLMFNYLDSSLRLLVENEDASQAATQFIQSAKTFIFIAKFLKKKAPSLSVTIPRKWYESY